MLAVTISDNVLMLTFRRCDAEASIVNARRLTLKKKRAPLTEPFFVTIKP